MLYGDEIGMVEDLALEGRMSVRTPMQWASGSAAPASPTAPAGELVRRWSRRRARRVNVADQRRDPDSLLRFMRRLVAPAPRDAGARAGASAR